MKGQVEEWRPPGVALERGAKPTHRRGLSGVQGGGPRAGAGPGSGSAGGCSDILPGN